MKDEYGRIVECPKCNSQECYPGQIFGKGRQVIRCYECGYTAIPKDFRMVPYVPKATVSIKEEFNPSRR